MNNPIRVLLVEDNPGDAVLTRETLEAGRIPVEVSVSGDGIDALSYLTGQLPYASATRPDVILLDLNLPKLDGRHVLAEIKRHDGLRTIPVIIMSSSDAPDDIEETYALGASCYVTKPMGLEAYEATVRSVEEFWLSVAKLP